MTVHKTGIDQRPSEPAETPHWSLLIVLNSY